MFNFVHLLQLSTSRSGPELSRQAFGEAFEASAPVANPSFAMPSGPLAPPATRQQGRARNATSYATAVKTMDPKR